MVLLVLERAVHLGRLIGYRSSFDGFDGEDVSGLQFQIWLQVAGYDRLGGFDGLTCHRLAKGATGKSRTARFTQEKKKLLFLLLFDCKAAYVERPMKGNLC